MTWQTELLREADWPRLRSVRLQALRQDPRAFLSSFEAESAYDESKWRSEYSRGSWTLLVEQGKTVGLLGVTREAATAPGTCYLEYMWVHPAFRKGGRGSGLVDAVLQRLKEEGIRTVLLWVLDGNSDAVRLYERIGFRFTGKKQPLPHDRARNENLMEVSLSSGGWARSGGEL